jgi:hypothetical protein
MQDKRVLKKGRSPQRRAVTDTPLGLPVQLRCASAGMAHIATTPLRTTPTVTPVLRSIRQIKP